MQKKVVDLNSVRNFVKDRYAVQDDDVSYINSGEFSSAFLLSSAGKKMIFRVNLDTDLGFKKDDFIHTNYPSILSPKIVETGRFGEGGFYSLSEMVPGKQLNQLSTEENVHSFPSLFSAMNEIHSSVVSDSNLLNQNEWKSILRNYTVSGRDKIEASFFDEERYKRLLEIFERKLEMDLPYSYLLHGDFGRTNIFAENSKITGIIDWSEAMRGDYLWDLAWIAFWPTEIDFVGSYYEFNKKNSSLDLSNFEVRLSLYRLVIGIHTLLFAGMRNDEQTYGEAVEKTEKFLV